MSRGATEQPDGDGHGRDAATEAIVEASVQEALDLEREKRQWLRAIVPLLQLRSHESDPSGRVQLAYDLMHIAACERASRLLRSDVGDPS